MGPGRRTAHETFLFPFFFRAAPLAPGDKMSLARKPNEQSNLTQINILKKKEEKKSQHSIHPISTFLNLDSTTYEI